MLMFSRAVLLLTLALMSAGAAVRGLADSGLLLHPCAAAATAAAHVCRVPLHPFRKLRMPACRPRCGLP